MKYYATLNAFGGTVESGVFKSRSAARKATLRWKRNYDTDTIASVVPDPHCDGRYSFYIEGKRLTWDIIHKADYEVGGFIEEVDEDLIMWHSLRWRQVAKALRFIRINYGIEIPRSEIYESHIDGCCDHVAKLCGTIEERR